MTQKFFKPIRFHLIIDAFDCRVSLLSDKNFLIELVKKIAKMIDMKIIKGPEFAKGIQENPGLSIFAIIDFSHISIHTFTYSKELSLDIFSCKPFDYKKVENCIQNSFKIKDKQISKSIIDTDFKGNSVSDVEILEHKNHKFMFVNEYLWMWDTPQEKDLQKNLADKAYGDVLVAGYGLGLLPEYILKNSKVKSITTVEKYNSVMEKMKSIGPIYGKVIVNDFYKLPENKKYDCIIGDIWPDIDAKFLKDYVRFKNKSRKLLKKDGLLLAWGKDYFEFLLDKKNLPPKNKIL
ncbi:MAG: S-adenosylmethionine decarboxylase [Patescibacteria group bacterium]